MKPFFQRPRFGLTSASLWSMGIGLLGFVLIAFNGMSPWFLLAFAPYFLVGLFLWQEQSWAAWAGLILYGLSTCMRVLLIGLSFQWKHVGFAVFSGALAFDCWLALRKMKEPLDDDFTEEDDDKEMISFVLLQRSPKYLEDVILAKMLEAAWGGTYSTGGEDDDDAEDESDGFVVGETPMFVIQSPHGMFLVHNHDHQYWESTDELVDEITELRLRKSVADHRAWVSVDLIQSSDEDREPEDYYPWIAKLILELADEETLSIVRPAQMEINVWSEELAERMNAPNAHETFAQQDNVPVIRMDEDDVHLQAAVMTAHERWPDFVAAFHHRTEESDQFSIKAKVTENEATEFIWIDVIGIEPRYVHGTLANDPVELGDLKLGTQIEVPLEDMQDWCYFDNGEPVGLFSLEAIQKSRS